MIYACSVILYMPLYPYLKQGTSLVRLTLQTDNHLLHLRIGVIKDTRTHTYLCGGVGHATVLLL